MKQKLKVGELLAINSQDDLNDLAKITGVSIDDAIVIDDEYVAYLEFIGSDENGAIKVEKVEDYRSDNPHDTKKPTKFSKFKRKFI